MHQKTGTKSICFTSWNIKIGSFFSCWELTRSYLGIIHAICVQCYQKHLQIVFFIKIFCENNFDTNDSDMNFILLQRRFDASCIIFKLQVITIRITITFN